MDVGVLWGFANQGPHVLSLVLSKVALSTAGGLKGQCLAALAFVCKVRQISQVWWHDDTIDVMGYLESIQTVVVLQVAKLCACGGGMLLSMVTQFAMETWNEITWTLNTSKMHQVFASKRSLDAGTLSWSLIIAGLVAAISLCPRILSISQRHKRASWWLMWLSFNTCTVVWIPVLVSYHLYAIPQDVQFWTVSRKIAPGGWLTAAFPGREQELKFH